MREELRPTKLVKIKCYNCGELMAKLYPNHTFNVNIDAKTLCKKCVEKRMNGTLKIK